MARFTVRALALGIVASAILAGCGESGGTKAGGVEPVTLRIGTQDDQGRPGAEQSASSPSRSASCPPGKS